MREPVICTACGKILERDQAIFFVAASVLRSPCCNAALVEPNPEVPKGIEVADHLRALPPAPRHGHGGPPSKN